MVFSVLSCLYTATVAIMVSKRKLISNENNNNNNVYNSTNNSFAKYSLTQK